MMDPYRYLPVEKEIDVLKEQLLMFKTIAKEKKMKKPSVSVADYERYLQSTKRVVKNQIEPASLIRRLRTKGDFY